MKTWEETWTAQKDCVVEDQAWGTLLIPHEDAGTDDARNRARAQLASAAPDLVRALLAHEKRIVSTDGECASCGATVQFREHLETRADGHRFHPPYLQHAPSCALDAALRKAGVR